MWIFEQNNHRTSFDDWIKACECEFKEGSMMMKIEEKDKIIICAKEDFAEAFFYLNGEKEIPKLNDSIDVLGDIEGFDLETEETFEYFECDIRNDIVDTRGVYNYFWKEGKVFEYKDKDGHYVTWNYPHRKGYSSFMIKVWSDCQSIWVE